MRRLLSIVTVILLAACTFNPDLTGGDYWPCDRDGACPLDCDCLEAQVCIHSDGLEPKHCAWCPEGHTLCSKELPEEGCARLASDPNHCGECFNVCPDGFVCEYGACAELCREGLIDCDRACVNPETDPQNCGECGRFCGQDRACGFGMCEKECPEETVDCSGACVNTGFDPAHCGGCDNACALTNATSDCVEDTCVIFECLDTYENCDQLDYNGCEVCLETDPNNCGECWMACHYPPMPTCEGDELTFYLDTGDCVSSQCQYESSTRMCLYGCENGACIGDPCMGVSCNLNQHCEAGQCVCDGLFGDCDTNSLNGCETYLNSGVNCGECGNTCGQNAYCVDGVCGCNFGYGDCNGSWADGCETDLLYNDRTCGSCDGNCGAGLTCCSGQCVDTNSDRGNCGNCTTFCVGMTECCRGTCTDTQLNEENCGSCGNVCQAPSSTCCWGSCVDAMANIGNCGECGNACALNIPCHQGACGAQGVYCGVTTCDFWEESCCYGSGGIACNPTGDCTVRIVECDDDTDCGDFLYCCLVDDTQYITQCTSSCSNVVCSSDKYCMQTDPISPHCCASDFYGQLVNTCLSELCQ